MYITHSLSKIYYTCYKSYNNLTPNHVCIARTPPKRKACKFKSGEKLNTCYKTHFHLFRYKYKLVLKVQRY